MNKVQISQILSIIQNRKKNFVLKSAFCNLHNDLMFQHFDTSLSGCTANVCFFKKDILTCANVGDSRCVIGTLNKPGMNLIKMKAKSPSTKQTLVFKKKEERALYWRSIALSIDHKPNKPQEKARIEKAGGIVKTSLDPSTRIPGPARVWTGDATQAGLAMSRSLGDGSLKHIGVTSEPEIREIELKEQDKFLVIATDGIWDVFSNKEVVLFVVPFWEKGDPQEAARALVEEA